MVQFKIIQISELVFQYWTIINLKTLFDPYTVYRSVLLGLCVNCSEIAQITQISLFCPK